MRLNCMRWCFGLCGLLVVPRGSAQQPEDFPDGITTPWLQADVVHLADGMSLESYWNANQWNNSIVADGEISIAGSPVLVNGSPVMRAADMSTFALRNATATGSMALSGATATSTYSFAGGLNALSTGSDSLSFGSSSQATKSHAVAIGLGARATGYAALAFGRTSWSSGIESIALGRNTLSSGLQSTAIGRSASSTGSYASSLGYFTTSNAYCQIVLGMYNKICPGNPTTWVATDRLFVLGNGTDESTSMRSDAIVTLKNGQTTLTNKEWSANPQVQPSAANSNAEALVVAGHTRLLGDTALEGKVVMLEPQGDISMGNYD